MLASFDPIQNIFFGALIRIELNLYIKFGSKVSKVFLT